MVSLANGPNTASPRYLGRGQCLPLPDFITSARRELIESAAFFVFFVGAILSVKAEELQ